MSGNWGSSKFFLILNAAFGNGSLEKKAFFLWRSLRIRFGFGDGLGLVFWYRIFGGALYGCFGCKCVLAGWVAFEWMKI